MWLGGWPELRLMRNVLSELCPLGVLSSRSSVLSEFCPAEVAVPPEVGLSLCGGLACDEGGSGSCVAETGDVT